MMPKVTKLFKIGLILSSCLVIVTFISTLFLSFFEIPLARTSAGIECFSLAFLLFFFQKYAEQTVSKEADYWIPRKFGLGMSINPHTKTSKRGTTLLVCLLILGGILLIFL
ncbi:hypothetical protein [Lactococcus taiwanensis]|uniref:hypothetical protein n=1 Tax=Lactococcus taiwanensis TaxID=1151742 RepID=UPI0007B1BFA3|nr:hypothetical protein P7266_1984 [Lactococcus cremoris]